MKTPENRTAFNILQTRIYLKKLIQAQQTTAGNINVADILNEDATSLRKELSSIKDKIHSLKKELEQI